MVIANLRFNCTFMELKLLTDNVVTNLFISFNCTFMELK